MVASPSDLPRLVDEAFGRRLATITAPNQAWSMVWVIDYVCSLTCVYCDNARVTSSHGSPASREQAIQRILAKRPGYLTVTGGEPVLVPDLVAILERLHRELDNTDITLNTSLAAKRDDLYRSLFPYLRGLSVSLDGVGEVNRIQRGIDGSRVLRRLERLLPAIRERELHLYVNCVVTVHNYAHIRELFEALDRITPRVRVGLAPVVPMDHELSIFRDQRMVAAFLADYQRIKDEHGENRVDFNGYSEPSTHCYSQLLDAFIYPDGTLKTCAAKKFSHDFTGRFLYAHAAKHWRSDYAHLAEFAGDFLRHRPSTLCFQPCNTSHLLNTCVHQDPALRAAIFEPSRSIREALVGSLACFKYDLLRRKTVEKFFTAESVRLYDSLRPASFHRLFYQHDYHEVLTNPDLDLRRVSYRVVERGPGRARVRVWIKHGRRVFARFPIHDLVLGAGGWQVSLPALLAAVASSGLPGFPPWPTTEGPPAGVRVAETGVAWEIVRAGRGRARSRGEQRVRLHYAWWTRAGQVFLSTLDAGDPETAVPDDVPQALAAQLRDMAIGERRRTYFPEALGDEVTGASGSGVVGADWELVAIEPPPDRRGRDGADRALPPGTAGATQPSTFCHEKAWRELYGAGPRRLKSERR